VAASRRSWGCTGDREPEVRLGAAPEGRSRASEGFPCIAIVYLSRNTMTRFHTVVTGAGISFEAPSNLPTSEALATMAWEVLAATVDLQANVVEEVSRRILDQTLRLEQLLDVMTVGGHGVPLEVLVSAYAAVESTAFNRNHVALSRLSGARHFTVNMDTLLEEAAAANHQAIDVTHLHGQWDQPGEISTTISQYLAQLAPDLESEFRAALGGRDVLVAGYSARDRDIQPLFLKYPPASLTWLVYPSGGGCTSNPAELRAKELAPEAIRLLDALRTSKSTTVHEVRSTVTDFLGTVASLPVAGTSRGVAGARDEVRDAYGQVDAWRRQLSVAAVLANQGLGEHVMPVLRRARVPRVEQGARIAGRKMMARVLRGQGRRGRAMITLLAPVTANYSAQIRSVANEAAATLSGTRLRRLADPVDTALARRAHGMAEFLVRTRLAQRQSARGKLKEAEASFREIGATFGKAQVGLGNWVNYLTWHADALKVLGRVKEAIRLLTDDLEDAYYADASQAGALNWKLAELLLVSRGPDPLVLKRLSEIAAAGPEALGLNQHCWVQLTRYGASAGLSLDGPELEVLQATATKRADTQMFWELQQAEVSRVNGDIDAALAHVAAAHRIERDRSRWAGSATGKLAGELIAVTSIIQRDERRSTGAVAKLSAIAAAFERLGAALPAARARVNASLAGGQRIGDREVESWKVQGWEVEAARARDPQARLGDMWQIVM